MLWERLTSFASAKRNAPKRRPWSTPPAGSLCASRFWAGLNPARGPKQSRPYPPQPALLQRLTKPERRRGTTSGSAPFFQTFRATGQQLVGALVSPPTSGSPEPSAQAGRRRRSPSFVYFLAKQKKQRASSAKTTVQHMKRPEARHPQFQGKPSQDSTNCADRAPPSPPV